MAAGTKGYFKPFYKSLAEAEMWWMHLAQMAYSLSSGGRVHDALKLVCIKHEGIPLRYKNITKHEKARTGVIVHLSSLRRGEKYRYHNLVKKASGLPEKQNVRDTFVHDVLTMTTPIIIM